MLSADLDGQRGFAIFHNGQTEFYPTKNEAEKRERAIAEERIRNGLREAIAKELRAYVKTVTAQLKGDRTDYARGIRSELERTKALAALIEGGDLTLIRKMAEE